MWGQNICIVIFPSFLAITYLGQSIYLHSIADLYSSPLATCLASYALATRNFPEAPSLLTIGYASTMTVNTLVTGMIVFRILKVVGITRPTSESSVERILGVTASEGNKFRHIMFIIIESGMALFVIQLALVVMVYIPVPVEQEFVWAAATDFVIVINGMLIVIITTSVYFYFF